MMSSREDLPAKGYTAFSNSAIHWGLSAQTREPFGGQFTSKPPTSKTAEKLKVGFEKEKKLNTPRSLSRHNRYECSPPKVF